MRLTIRPLTYRGRLGFCLSGGGRGIFGAKIFVETRAAAERMREKLRAGEDITLADFHPELTDDERAARLRDRSWYHDIHNGHHGI